MSRSSSRQREGEVLRHGYKPDRTWISLGAVALHEGAPQSIQGWRLWIGDPHRKGHHDCDDSAQVGIGDSNTGEINAGATGIAERKMEVYTDASFAPGGGLSHDPR